MCAPSIVHSGFVAFVPAIAVPLEASATFSPMSLSSAVATTNRSATPGAETRKVAVSSSRLPSAAAARVTTCHALQFAAVNVRVAPLLTVRFASPELWLTVTATLPVGARSSRMKKRPSPSSRTLTLDELSSGPGLGPSTRKVRITTGAGFQFASPSCEAATLTAPVPVKARFVPAEIVAGPLVTAKLVGRPLEAAAANPTVAEIPWSSIGGNPIVCAAFDTASVPEADPE